MKINEIVESINGGSVIVKSSFKGNFRLRILPSMEIISYKQYRKLLFEGKIKMRNYDKYNDMSWFVSASNSELRP